MADGLAQESSDWLSHRRIVQISYIYSTRFHQQNLRKDAGKHAQLQDAWTGVVRTLLHALQLSTYCI